MLPSQDSQWPSDDDQATQPNKLASWLRHTGIEYQLRSALEERDTNDCNEDIQLSIHVDVLTAMAADVELGMMLINNTEKLRLMMMQHLHQQGTLTSKFNRVWLRMIKVPLPLMSLPQTIKIISNCSSTAVFSNIPDDITTSSKQPVHLYALVTGLSTVQPKLYTRRICCGLCGTVQDVLGDGISTDHYTPCCEFFSMQAGTCNYEEDLSGRVLIPHQSIYVAPLSSATGCSSYGLGPEPLLVHAEEELAGSCFIGDIIEITGTAYMQASMSMKDGGAARLQVSANNIRPVVPHLGWGAQFSVTYQTQQQQEPLQFLVDALGASVDQELHATTALALLLSAASVPAAATASPAAAAASQALVAAGTTLRTTCSAAAEGQVSVLMLQPAHAPDCIRDLRAAASLLSPHSVMLSAQMEDLLQPRCSTAARQLSADGQQLQVAFGSALSLANKGIAVADLCSLPVKVVKHLMDALGRPVMAVPKCPGIQVPISCTMWAVGPDTAINPDALDFGVPCSKGIHATGGIKPENFDIVIDYVSQNDGLQALFAPIDAEDTEEHKELRASLQAHITRAMLMGPVQLTVGAQELLQHYYLMVRQNMVAVRQGDLLATLIKLATACARLCHRRQVQPSPDAAAAVLMMEATLKTRFGSSYQSLDLPEYEQAQQPSLDAYLALVHKLVSQQLRLYGGTGEE